MTSDDNQFQRTQRNTILSFIFNISNNVFKLIGDVILANIGGSAVLGVYYTFDSVYSLLVRFTSFGMGQSLTKRISEQKNIRRERRILGAALMIRIITSTVTLCVLFLVKNQVDSYIGLDGAWLLLWTILTVFLAFATFRADLLGRKRVGLASGLDISREVIILLLQIGLVFIGWGSMGMIYGFGFGMGIGVIAVLAIVRLFPLIPRREDVRHLIEFAKYSYVDSLVGGRRRWIDVIILGYFVGPEEIGVYGIIYSLSRAGMALSTAIGQSIFPEISDATENEDYNAVSWLLNYSIQYSTLLSIPAMFGILIVGKGIITLIYDFDIGWESFVILSLGMIFYSAYQPLHQILYGLDRPGLSFRLSLVGISVNIIINIILIPSLGILGAAVATASSQFIVFLAGYLLVSKIGKVTIQWDLQPWFVQFSAAIIMTLTLLLLNIINDISNPLYLIIEILSSGALYTFIIAVFDNNIKKKLSSYNPLS